MAYRIPAQTQNDNGDDARSRSGSSSSGMETDDDDNCSDWASDFGEALQTKSLFCDTVFKTPEEVIAHDQSTCGVDIRKVKEKLGLDVYGLMRLVNLVRKDALKAEEVLAIKTDDPRLKDDSYLVPTIADDPLLQLDFDDSWSDDGEPAPSTSNPAEEDAPSSDRVKALEKELEKARSDLSSMRKLLQETMDENDRNDESAAIPGPSKGKGKSKIPAGRDDDTHYFDSYAENDIHEIMLKDTTRTISYAKFILSNPSVFKDAIVMDVGCGTGILSMFAARAGAKQVFAIEASGLASKARENIKNNGLDGVITVIQGKVENIELPVKHVDVIISEWMGYMLLYESMLDSVLDARDRFLGPNGLMAPSQTRLVLSAITGDRVWKERVDFWKGVYGFDMTAMNSVYFDEGLVEYVDANEIVTDEYVVRDINTHDATPKSLDFHSSFTLVAKSKATIRAFLTHFDTFFSPKSGATGSHASIDSRVDLTKYGAEDYGHPVKVDQTGPETPISFTTGPLGTETHWRQVVFLLRQPIEVEAGDEIQGRFSCRKSTNNSRELDVEIHYGKKGEGERTVVGFKVR